MPGYVRPRKIKNGKTHWQARWRPPEDARDNVRREKTFATKGEANDWWKKLDQEHKIGSYVDPRRGDKPFKEVAAEWLATKTYLEPTTGYAGIIKAWYMADRDPLDRRPPFNRKISAIGAPQIEEWLQGFQPKRSHRTMVKVYGMLSGKKGIMAFAVQKGYIAFNPCINVTMPPAPKAEYDPKTGEFIEEPEPDIVILDRDEITQLAAAFDHEPYRVAVIFDAWMGLRAGELWALQRRDFDIDLHGVVKVRRSWKEVHDKDHVGPKLFLGPLKTAAARRDLHMPPEHVWQMMKRYFGEHVGAKPTDFVFTTPDGHPVRQSNFRRREFKPTVESVLPHKSHLRFHDLRHTAASIILAVRENDLITVKQRLGHAKIETTINIYGHLVRESDEKLAVALDAYAAQPVKQTLRQISAARD